MSTDHDFSTDSHMTHPKNAPSYSDMADQMEKITRKEPDMLNYTEKQFIKEGIHTQLDPIGRLDQQHIKDPYQQFETSTTTAAPGTGVIVADADEIAAAYAWKQTVAANAQAETPVEVVAERDHKVYAADGSFRAGYIMDPKDDRRNVADEFKGMSIDAIRLAMQPRRTKLVNVAMNLGSDFNKSAVLRSSEAHGCREFVLVNKVNDQDPTNPEGVKKFDSRGAVGMKNYHPFKNVVDWKKLFAEYRAEGYTIFAVDNTAGYDPQPIYNVEFPERSVLVYGEEGLGLSQEMIEACDAMVYIPQFGVVRSLNISQAAAICMYEYSRQWKPVL